MSKTTACTFAAAVILLAASFAINDYGDYIIAAQRAAERGLSEFPVYYDDCNRGLNAWERASGLTGLLAISVSVAGALLWNRETQPETKRSSILGLNELTAGQIVRRVAQQNIVSIAATRIDESNAHLHEEEYLTPLERVIRGC
jgi:hypothetical protein